MIKPKKIIIFTKYDRLGASSRLRSFQYLPYLNELGYNVTIKPLFSDQYLKELYAGRPISKLYVIKRYLKRLRQLFTISKYRIIWIEKELFPYLPPFFEYLLAKLGVKYIIDLDDAIFHNYDLSKNWAIRTFLHNKIDTVMKYSSTVTAGNSYLAKRALDAGANNVQIIPTVIDETRYTPKVNLRKKLSIGWIGTPSTQKYIVDISKILNALCTKYNVRLILIGASPSIAENFIDTDIVITPWSECTEVNDISKIDIGIMPLEDGSWEKGKCGYKLIQYMACGKPVIASNVGVNKEIINKSDAGFIVNDIAEWEKHLKRIVTDEQLRIDLGNNARQSVIENYSIKSQLPVWNNIFNKLLNS